MEGLSKPKLRISSIFAHVQCRLKWLGSNELSGQHPRDLKWIFTPRFLSPW